jgi:hypothetical protein
MKAFIFTFMFLLHFLIPIKSNDNIVSMVSNETVDNNQKLGILYEDKGHVVKFISDDEIIFLKVKVYKKELDEQSQRSFKSYAEEIRFGYTIVGISESTFNGELTSTWLYGFWVKVNGAQVSRALYPRGKDIMVYTTPTELYYFETEETSVLIKVGWVESIYEPKIIK